MPSDIFSFKHFNVRQRFAGMKVCTDSCLFGAWAAAFFSGRNPGTIADLGTGTGLLALMLAQKCGSSISGIEIDENALKDCEINFSASTCQERLALIQGDARTLTLPEKFDAIICNPPFYSNVLQGNDVSRTKAMHTVTLMPEDIFAFAKRHLTGKGECALAIMVPFYRRIEFIQLASRYHFHVCEICKVQQTPKHNYFRAMMIFSLSPSFLQESEITIKDVGDTYSEGFRVLLKDYYLHF